MISELLSSFVGIIGWLLLILLPGAWVTFGLRLSRFPFFLKLLMGMALAPFVVCLQFYALRLLGASFETTVPLLVIINLPALYLIHRRRVEISFPGFQTLLGAAVVLLIPVALLVPQLLDSQVRVFTGHAWMQSDIVYMLVDGNLRLEEPELAGLKMVYPWAAHPFQAVLSYLLNSAPASSYIWTNLVVLACIYGFSAYTVAELGGNRFSRITSFLWLCFGLNFAGYAFFIMIPGSVDGTFWDHGPYYYAWIGGDYRITPWLLKFFFFEQSIYGLCMLSAIIYLLIKERASGQTFDSLILLGLLLCGIGLIYPVYFAPAAIAVCCAALTFFLDRARPEKPDYFQQCLGLGAVLLTAAVVTFANVKFISVDRTIPSIILPSLSFHFAKYTLIKSVSSGVVLAVLLGGLGFAFRRCWKDNRNATIILAGSGLGIALLYILLEIPKPSAEYKFLLTAALFLAPFPVLALQPYLERLKGKALPVFALIAFVLVAPAAHKIYTDFPWTPPWPHPAADASSFDLRLKEYEPLAPLCDAIRQKTPPDAILVIEKSHVHFPTLTHRRLYAPPLQDKPHPGVFIMSNLLLETQKGYGREIITSRRLVVNELFNSPDDNRRAQSVEQILGLKAPIAIILELPPHAALHDWLAADARNSRLFDDGIMALWLIMPRDKTN